MNYKLQIVSYMWNKESNYLFDYESDDYSVAEITTEKDGFLATNEENDLMIYDQIDDPQEDEKYFCEIQKKDNNFVLNFDMKNFFKEEDSQCFFPETWLSVRHSKTTKNNLFKLKKDNIIKFGKVIYRVRDLVLINDKDSLTNEKMLPKLRLQINNASSTNLVNSIKDGESPHSNDQSNIQNCNNFMFSLKESKIASLAIENNKKSNHVKKTNNLCRICLSEECDEINQMICPCKCSGTMKYIHFECLKQWIKSKLNTKTFNYSIVSDLISLECELCKSPIPEKIKIKNKIHDLIDFERPSSNYVLLESLMDDLTEKRFFYLINMKNENELTIVFIINLKGRALDVDVRMGDISISRYHSKLSIIDGEYYLQDHSSKYGTLLQTHNEIMLIPNKKLSIQFGRYLISFKVKKTFCSIFRCFSSITSPFGDYNDCLYKHEEKEEFKECGYVETNMSKHGKEVTEKNTNSNVVLTECISESYASKKVKNEMRRLVTDEVNENDINLLSSKRGLIGSVNKKDYTRSRFNSISLYKNDQGSKDLKNVIYKENESMDIGNEYNPMEKEIINYYNSKKNFKGNSKTLMRSFRKLSHEENSNINKDEDTSFLYKKKNSSNIHRFSFRAIDESNNKFELKPNSQINLRNKFPSIIDPEHPISFNTNSYNQVNIEIFDEEEINKVEVKNISGQDFNVYNSLPLRKNNEDFSNILIHSKKES